MSCDICTAAASFVFAEKEHSSMDDYANANSLLRACTVTRDFARSEVGIPAVGTIVRSSRWKTMK